MPQVLQCPNGHDWEVTGSAATLPLGQTCPVCGAAPAGDAPTVPPPDPHATAPPAARSGELSSLVPETIAGYELLGELGRGGMGVVYKARQTQLNRLVALKMILAGGFADEQERARFRTEAEAVARLQHPGIVQIHEIGEHHGLPYFALEYCPGGSLAGQLDGTPWLPQRAAQLVEAVADAVYAAHEAGIVHRD